MKVIYFIKQVLVESIFQYALIGMLIGFLSGVFGIGGSIISTPVLKIMFGLPDLIALATPLPVTIPTAIAGVYGYWKKGIVHKKIALAVIIGGLPATIAGAYLTKYINSNLLMILTGIFVVLTGLRLLKGSLTNVESSDYKSILLKSVFIGIFAGLFSGLLAIGGGIILIPAFILLLGFSMQEAASISLLCVACFAIPGTLVHWHLHHIDWNIVLCLSIGVIPAGYLGSYTAMKLQSNHLQKVFSIFLILFGIYFVLQQL
jgi:uncharacterized membrane protein YfcA